MQNGLLQVTGWGAEEAVPLYQPLGASPPSEIFVKTKEQSSCWWVNDEHDVMGWETLLLSNVKCKAPALHSPPHLGKLNSPTACTLPWQMD